MLSKTNLSQPGRTSRPGCLIKTPWILSIGITRRFGATRFMVDEKGTFILLRTARLRGGHFVQKNMTCLCTHDALIVVLLVAALEETSHEAGGQRPLSPEVLLLEVGHDMRGLAPEVHGLLIIGMASEDQNIDDG